jgi:hypothetical protein
MAEKKLEPKLTEATAKTTAVLQILQSRLKRDVAPPETPDELGEELQHYFATASGPMPEKISKEIRNQVVDGVVERILHSWGENGQVAATIKAEVIARLVERVTAEILKKGLGQ